MAARNEERLEALGRFIRDRRLALGLTQTELGVRLGYAQERISVLEHGKYGMPSLPALVDIAAALELTVPELLVAAGYLPMERAASPPHGSEEATQQGLRYLTEQNTRLAAQIYHMQRNLMAIEQGLHSADQLRSRVLTNRQRMEELVRSCRSALLQP